jgi:hypothetical protein
VLLLVVVPRFLLLVVEEVSGWALLLLLYWNFAISLPLIARVEDPALTPAARGCGGGRYFFLSLLAYLFNDDSDCVLLM